MCPKSFEDGGPATPFPPHPLGISHVLVPKPTAGFLNFLSPDRRRFLGTLGGPAENNASKLRKKDCPIGAAIFPKIIKTPDAARLITPDCSATYVGYRDQNEMSIS